MCVCVWFSASIEVSEVFPIKVSGKEGGSLRAMKTTNAHALAAGNTHTLAAGNTVATTNTHTHGRLVSVVFMQQVNRSLCSE